MHGVATRVALLFALGLSLAMSAPLMAQGTAPVATTTPEVLPPAPLTPPTPPTSPVSAMRNKLSAGDLESAESILEVYRAKNGEDGAWLVGLSWLARGAWLLGQPVAAQRHASDVYARCAMKVASGVDLTKDSDVAYALGSAIEVEAQRLEQKAGKRKAIEYVQGELARWQGSVGFRSRLHKRLNLLTLVGTRAPEYVVEESLAEPAPTLRSLLGSPVLVYVFDKACGDCRGQSAALAKVKARHAADGLRVIALTRHYDDGDDRLTENARVDSVWKSVYADMGPVPIVVSEASMIRYGGSSTPTLVFIDRKGIVRRYAPVRLTEDALEREVTAILR